MDYTQLILGSLISFGVFAALFAAMIKTPVLTFTSALILCVLMLALPPETLPLDSASWAAPGLFLLAAAVLLSQPKFGQTSIIRVFTHVGLHLLVVYLMVSAAMAESETQSLTMHRPRPVDALPALLWMAAAIVPIHLLRFVSAPTRWGHHLRLGLSLRHAVRLQLPLPDALRASARNHRNAEAGVLNRLARVVEDGGTLSEAIRRWYPPKLYPWIGPLVSAEELHRPSDALEDICRTLRKRAHVPTSTRQSSPTWAPS
jgi:hypothetical protein